MQECGRPEESVRSQELEFLVVVSQSGMLKRAASALLAERLTSLSFEK